MWRRGRRARGIAATIATITTVAAIVAGAACGRSATGEAQPQVASAVKLEAAATPSIAAASTSTTTGTVTSSPAMIDGPGTTTAAAIGAGAAGTTADAPASTGEARGRTDTGETTGEGASPADAALDRAIAHALEPAVPDAIEVIARQPYRGGQVAIVGVDEAELWRASQRRAGTLEATEEAFGAAVEACEDASSESVRADCVLEAAPHPHVGWAAADARAVAIDVVRLSSGTGGLTLTGRQRLIDLAVLGGGDDELLKLQVFDIDRDGSDEITAIVPLGRPSSDAFTQVSGAIAGIFDVRAVSPQLVITRFAYSEYSHAMDHQTSEVSARWLARDLNADGHPDLRIREVIRETDAPTRERTLACLYAPTEDRWTCPEPLVAGDAILRADPRAN